MNTKKTGKRFSRRKFIQKSASSAAGMLAAGTALGATSASGCIPK